jgi:hypothetical protein
MCHAAKALGGQAHAFDVLARLLALVPVLISSVVLNEV